MTKEPGHPRHETEEERVEAYKELRKNIARQIRTQGVPLLAIPLTERRVTATGRDFVNGRRNQDFSLYRIHTELSEPQLVLNLNELDETDTLQQTQFIAIGRGPFIRNEFSAPTIGAAPGSYSDDGARMAEHFAANLDAMDSGLTGHPITDEEARGLIDLVADAEPLPDPLGRTPTPW
jgi:hypothetical protein